MGIFDALKPKKSVEEIEQETESAKAEDELRGVQLSIAQKIALTKQLKERGLNAKNFGDTRDEGTWHKIMTWLKSH
jgi:hypothetical protein